MVSGSRYDVAFILVTYNAAPYIRKCVESIITHFPPTERSSKIIVVDNASTDETRSVLTDIKESFEEVDAILLDRNIGFGPANNVGFSAVAARRYVLLNTDAWLVGDSISPALSAMEGRPEIAVCGLPLVFPDGSPQTHAYPFSSWKKWLFQFLGFRAIASKLMRIRGLDVLLGRLPLGREFVRSQTRPRLPVDQMNPMDCSGALRQVDWVCGAAMVLDGDFVHQVGGFDPAIFLYGEDEDLCVEAHRHGREVAAVDALPVAHVVGWQGNGFNRRLADLKYESIRYFIRKRINKPTPRLLMALLLPLHVYGWQRFYHSWLAKKRLELYRSGKA